MNYSRRDFLGLAAPASAVVLGAAMLEACGAKPAASPAAAADKASWPSLKVAYSAPGATSWPILLTDAIGAFQKHQVNVTTNFIQNSAAMAAVIAREIDVINTSGSPVITADFAGADLVFVAAAATRAGQSLYVVPSIQSAADLMGKTLATDKPATPNAYSMRLALKLLGLKPTDVTLRPLGGSNVELAALVAGQVQGAILGEPERFQAESSGYHDLQDTFSVPYQGNGMAVLRSRLNELSTALPRFLSAYRDGVQAFYDQPDLAKKVLQQHTKESDPEILQKTYDFFRNKTPFDVSLQPTADGVQGMLDDLVDTYPAAKTAKPEQFIDTRFLSQL